MLGPRPGRRPCPADRGGLGATAWAGYQRLVAVGEVIEPNEQWFRHVLARDAFAARNHWLTPKAEGGLGGRPIGLKVARQVLQGRLDPFDAIAKGADSDPPSLKAARAIEAVQ